MTSPEPPAPHESPTPSDSTPERQTAIARRSWAYPTMWMVIVLILVSGAVYVFKSCLNMPGETLDKTRKLVEKVGQEAEKVAAAFNQGTITTTFASYATSIRGSQHLQIAELSQTETFTRKDEASTAFGYVPLPDIIVEATAPVAYTYYVDLNERWDFLLKDGVVYVTAPDIRFNKPAVDASRITYEVKKNSLIRNTTEAMENLKSSITSLSYRNAKTNIELVRDTGRKQTETFVQNWLSRAFADGKSYPVKVRFRNEVQTNGPVILLRHE